MRPLALIFSVSLLLVSNGNAQAQVTPSSEVQSTSRVEVTAPERTFEFYRSEADWVSGGYKMSNGWRITVDAASDGIVAKIDKRSPIRLVTKIDTGSAIRLVAVSRDRYVSPDGNVVMEFNRGTEGDEMLMSYIPVDRTAQVIVASAKMAQN